MLGLIKTNHTFYVNLKLSKIILYWDRSGKILSVLLASDNQVKYVNNKMEISSLGKNCFFIKGKVHVLQGGN